MRTALPFAVLLLVSGCLVQQEADGGAGSVDCPKPNALWAPPASAVEVDGARRSDLVGFFPNASAIRIANVALPQGWAWDVQDTGPDDGNGTLVRFGVTAKALPVGGRDPSARTSQGTPLMVNWTTVATEGCARETGQTSWPILLAPSTRTAQPGDGVAVFYAGFWLNGTLFSTNIESIDRSAWPRGGWYESGDNKPLNVYVYDKDRSERAAYWAPTDPTTNQPAKWSYSPTILGFNNGLKGLTTGSTRVVAMPPEQAYTQPGREAHHLYGDSLVFFIDVVEIVDVPCPPEVVNRAACRFPV